MRTQVASLERVMERHPPKAPVVLAAIVLAAFGAKLGLGPWALGGLLSFYPAYLTLVLAAESAAARIARRQLR